MNMLKFIIIDTFIQFRAIETFFLKIVEKKFQIFSFGGPYEFDFLPLGYQRKKVKFVWSPKGKNQKLFFNYFQKKGLNCSELNESVYYDEFEPI